MFNVAVINRKDILKYLVSITITFSLVMGVTRYFSSLEKNNQFSKITQTNVVYLQKNNTS